MRAESDKKSLEPVPGLPHVLPPPPEDFFNLSAMPSPYSLPPLPVPMFPRPVGAPPLLGHLGPMRRPPPPPPGMPFHPGAGKVLEFLNNIWQDQKLCDVLVTANGGNVQAHRVALGAHSDALNKTFYNYHCNDMLKLDLSDFRSEVVMAILHFLYTTELELNCHLIGQVLACANELGMNVVMQQCIDYLSELNVNNAILHYSIAENNSLTDLRDRAFNYILENFSEISKTRHFLYLPYERLSRLLTAENICVDCELDVFSAVIRWIDFDPPNRQQYAYQLFKSIRFGKMSPESLVKEVESVNWLYNNPDIMRDYLYSAMKFNALHQRGSKLAIPLAPKARSCPRRKTRASQPPCDENVEEPVVVEQTEMGPYGDPQNASFNQGEYYSQPTTPIEPPVDGRSSFSSVSSRKTHKSSIVHDESEANEVYNYEDNTSPEPVPQPSVSSTQTIRKTTVHKKTLDQGSTQPIDYQYHIPGYPTVVVSPRPTPTQCYPGSAQGYYVPTQGYPVAYQGYPGTTPIYSTAPQYYPGTPQSWVYQPYRGPNQTFQGRPPFVVGVTGPPASPGMRRTLVKRRKSTKRKMNQHVASHQDQPQQPDPMPTPMPQPTPQPEPEPQHHHHQHHQHHEEPHHHHHHHQPPQHLLTPPPQVHHSTSDPHVHRSLVAIGGIDLESVDPDSPGRLLFSYNQESNNWITGVAHPLNRYIHHHGVGFVDGKLYVAGGAVYDSDHPENLGVATKEVSVFDSISRQWSSVAALNSARAYVCIAVWRHKLYAVGGEDEFKQKLDSVECYDPATNKWTVVTQMPGGPKVGAAAKVCLDRLFVVGGYNRDREDGAILADVECFDLIKNRWSVLSPLQVPRCHSALAQVDDRLFLIGGRTRTHQGIMTSLSSVEEYKFHNDTWVRVANLEEPRHDAGCATVGSRIYVVGGMRSPNAFCLKSVECFDVSSGTWIRGIQNFLYPVTGIACCSIRGQL